MNSQKDLGGNRHSGFVVVPGPASAGGYETPRQLGTTVVAEQFLANLSQAARKRGFDVDTYLGCFLSSHGARSLQLEPPSVRLGKAVDHWVKDGQFNIITEFDSISNRVKSHSHRFWL